MNRKVLIYWKVFFFDAYISLHVCPKEKYFIEESKTHGDLKKKKQDFQLKEVSQNRDEDFSWVVNMIGLTWDYTVNEQESTQQKFGKSCEIIAFLSNKLPDVYISILSQVRQEKKIKQNRSFDFRIISERVICFQPKQVLHLGPFR